MAQLQTNIEQFVKFFAQIDKYLRTLVKYLREQLQKCNDPKLIEHNQKQIKTIEGLLEDVKRAISTKEYSVDASRLLESLFLLSNESLKDVQTSALLQSSEDRIKRKRGYMTEGGRETEFAEPFSVESEMEEKMAGKGGRKRMRKFVDKAYTNGYKRGMMSDAENPRRSERLRVNEVVTESDA